MRWQIHFIHILFSYLLSWNSYNISMKLCWEPKLGNHFQISRISSVSQPIGGIEVKNDHYHTQF